MKVTPLEIRQKTFERTLRGYDKDEVNAYLLSLSQEWERLQDECKEYKLKLDAAEREVTKLREVETSLFKTLKTAEDTGASVIEQANKAAELHLKESQIRVEALMNEAKARAKNTMEEAEMIARQWLTDMEDQLKGMVQEYKTLDAQRENLLADLKRISAEAMERAERLQNGKKGFDPEQHLMMARRETKKSLMPNATEEKPVAPAPTSKPALSEVRIAAEVTTTEKLFQQSFFDDIQ
ncbi:MAG: DivIVA domain-containing protein [Cyclobacteriaceae bacterium]|nr:DivIVA domain-containing protein [Cyclobacteriaceae bacterium]